MDYLVDTEHQVNLVKAGLACESPHLIVRVHSEGRALRVPVMTGRILDERGWWDVVGEGRERLRGMERGGQSKREEDEAERVLERAHNLMGPLDVSLVTSTSSFLCAQL
jgi:hypothetical protein